MGLRVIATRPIEEAEGEGFRVLPTKRSPCPAKATPKLPMPLRRITIRRRNGKVLSFITNDMSRTAVEIGALTKAAANRTAVSMDQGNISIRKFLGNNQNAIKLQIYLR